MAATVNIGVFGVFNSPMAQMAVLPLTTSCTKEVDRGRRGDTRLVHSIKGTVWITSSNTIAIER